MGGPPTKRWILNGASLAVTVLIGAGVLGCARAATVEDQPRSGTSTTVADPTVVRFSWNAARTSADGRELLVTFTGAAPLQDGDRCTADYSLEVTETAERIVADVVEHKPDGAERADVACSLLGHSRTADTSLAEPLGTRELIDRQSGTAHPPFDGAKLLEPTSMPDGWKLRSENGGDTVHGPIWMRDYGSDGTVPSRGVTITQGPPEMLVTYLDASSYTSRGHRTIHGIDATLYGQPSDASTTILAWTEDGQGISVSGPVDPDQLATIASGLDPVPSSSPTTTR